MLSRAAEAIYWMSRYVERAENVARFASVNMFLMLDALVSQHEQWDPLITTTGDREKFDERYGEATRDNALYFLTFDLENPNSILSTLRHARENARSVREIITMEMWEALNKAYLEVSAAAAQGRVPQDPYTFYAAVRDGSHLFGGITDSTLSHGEAWHFARMGRLLERADKTSRILDVKYYILLPSIGDIGSPIDNIQWGALLKSAAAYQMYRQVFQRLSPERVAEFLILDRLFPRSIRHCLSKAEESLRAITGTPPMTFTNPAEQSLGRMRAELDYTRIDEIISTGLHEYLDQFQTRLNEVGSAIFNTFFAIRPIVGASRSHNTGSDQVDLLSGDARQ